MIRAKLSNFSYHLPQQTLENEDLASLYPTWTSEKILAKTGVRRRHIARTDETASDLAFHAAERLLQVAELPKESIDFLIFCSQTPDYFLPSTSCVLQQRLGLSQTCGAVDVGQGCSGYVYCLGLAKGLIESRQARRVLILTADTYSKLIHPLDKSVRTLFGDAGAASIVDGVDTERERILPCIFGTDGRGADKLIVPTGAFREARSISTAKVYEDQSGNSRARDSLYMDGADVLTFSLREVPRLVAQLLDRSQSRLDEIDHFVFHQGSKLMLEMLRKKLGIAPAKFVIDIEETGNTVSSTLPVALTRLFGDRRAAEEKKVMLIGFGVGYSWAGTIAVI